MYATLQQCVFYFLCWVIATWVYDDARSGTPLCLAVAFVGDKRPDQNDRPKDEWKGCLGGIYGLDHAKFYYGGEADNADTADATEYIHDFINIHHRPPCRSGVA